MGTKRILKRAAIGGGLLLGLLLVLAVVAGIWAHHEVKDSLPQLAGQIEVEGLRDPVNVERDALGVPTLTASNAVDLALAHGFVHAQDRFFQMDTLRRVAAGELSGLIGPPTVDVDRQRRVHRLRERARAVVRRADPAELKLVEAYTRGVNAGLRSLGEPPFEYLALRVEPEPWRVEDSALVLLAMFIQLQDEDGRLESSLATMRDALPEPLVEFLAPRGTEWDAPLVGDAFPMPPIPGPEVADMRTMEAWAGLRSQELARLELPRHAEALGSNSWAVAGALTAHGAGLLAGDMHLGHDMPNIWYRTSLVWRDGETGEERRATGVTLPGAFGVIAGSNEHVAWAYTNSYADWSDVVLLDIDPDDENRYLTPEGYREFERHEETIQVQGAEPAPVDVVSTIWGPVIGEDHRGRPRAVRWVAHDPQAVNFRGVRVQAATSLEDAMARANRAGIPGQNFVAVDDGGRIGWTIMGVLPRRRGFDGRLPQSWADGSRGWDGWLAPEDYPRIVDPASGRLWTANSRTVDGEMLRKLGDGGFPLGARAMQIRDGLFELDRATELDMLAIQLDDRARLLERWRTLLLDLLTPEAVAGNEQRSELRRLVEKNWTGRASIDSAGYRLVRAFRLFLWEHVRDAITLPCATLDPEFRYVFRQWEGPLWTLASRRPAHLVDPRHATWEDWMLAVVDYTLDYYLADGKASLAEKTWGNRNTLRMTHPLSRAVPWLESWLDAPRQPLPGDSNMPRVQGVNSGASQRMVVSPGRQEHGLFHMPGGQSGHPLSPHYLDGHAAWAEGRPTPFLPGPAVHTLTLTPPG